MRQPDAGFLRDRFPLLQDFVAAFEGELAPATLVFGDSVMLRAAAGEPGGATLQDLLRRDFGRAGRGFFVLGSAFNPHMFLPFVRLLEKKTSRRPASVILPVNLRVFSPTWDLLPDYQFAFERAVLEDVLAGRAVRREAIPVTAAARSVYRGVPVSFPGEAVLPLESYLQVIANRPPEAERDLWEGRLKVVFKLHYQHPLHEGHRQLQALTRCVEILRALGIRVFAYFTPINHEAGTRYAGAGFSQSVRANQALVSRSLRQVGLNVVADFAFRFDAGAFFTPHNATEHLRLAARRNLAGAIRSLWTVDPAAPAAVAALHAR